MYCVVVYFLIVYYEGRMALRHTLWTFFTHLFFFYTPTFIFMLLVFAITFSILAITVSFLRKISNKPRNTMYNPELDKYFSLSPSSSPQILYKHLVNAAAFFLASSEELEKSISSVEPLYKDRLVSDDYYEDLISQNKDLELQKMIIESECETLKKGSKEQLFQDASKVKMPPKKSLKVFEDPLFSHKREVMQNELKKRLLNV